MHTAPTAQPSDRLARFHAEMANLNPRQRQAVESIGSPTLVIAGPGTGKTQLLAMRVAYQLVHSDIQPREILCLTFTEAGAVAMRQRLQRLIGPEANPIGVYTFHSFCNEVIQTHLPELDLPQGMIPISELEHIQLVRKLIEGIPEGNPLRRIRGDLYYEQSRLIEFFGTLKHENWDPDEMAERIEQVIRYLPENPDFRYKVNTGKAQKGDPKTREIADVEKKLRATQAACRLFHDYEARLKQAKRYQFADMINWVLAGFRANPDLLLEYRERYQCVLVDEYQDTNGSQNALLQQLIEDPDGRPNVFVVCDDDQAIYRFQGAQPDNIADLYREYQDTFQVVCLTENYRSTQDILDVAATLIQHNTTSRLVNNPDMKRRFPELDKTLVAKGAANRLPHTPPQVQAYDSPTDEAAGILAQIEALLGPNWRSGDYATPPHEIAVLYSQHSHAEALVNVAAQRGIPVYLVRKQNLLHQPLIRAWLNLLSYVHDESRYPGRGDSRLFPILNLRGWGLSPETVHYIGARYALARSTALNARENSTDVVMPTFGPIIRQSAEDVALPPDQRQRLAHLAACLQKWVTDVPNLGLVPLLQTVLEDSGLLHSVANSPHRMAELKQFKQFFLFVENEARRAASPTQPDEPSRHLSLGDLLGTLAEMEELGVELQHDVAIGKPSGVQFVTAFSAKGLEYDHVFVIHVTEGAWGGKRRGNAQRYTLPKQEWMQPLLGQHTPSYTRAADQQTLEDRRRLLYVALTRAKKGLVVSYPLHSANGTPEERAGLLEEIATQHPAFGQDAAMRNTQPLTPTEDQLAEFLIDSFRAPQLRYGTPANLKELLATYRLSASGLNSWLDCRRRFYYEELLHIPSAYNANAAVGNVVHSTLHFLFRRLVQTGQWFSLSELQEEYLRRLDEIRAFLSAHQYDSFRLWATDYLPGYYQTFRPQWVAHCRNEYKFRTVTLGEVSVIGRIDKIEHTPDGLYLVDYKTGNPNSGKTDGPTTDADDGSEYWRQAMLYALMAEADPQLNSSPVAGFYFEYVVPDSKEQNVWVRRHVDLTPYAKEQFVQILERVWGEIQALTLDDILAPHNPDAPNGMCGACDWCKHHTPATPGPTQTEQPAS